MALSNGKMRAPGHRSVYLITFSPCHSSQLSRVEFAHLIVEAWHACSRSNIIQWVVCLESHETSGNHFHMAIKLSSPARWLKIRNFVDKKYGIKLNFSDSHTNYYTAYEYVVKQDPNFVLSSNHPDLSNGNCPRPQKPHAHKGRRPRRRKTRNENVLLHSM